MRKTLDRLISWTGLIVAAVLLVAGTVVLVLLSALPTLLLDVLS